MVPVLWSLNEDDMTRLRRLAALFIEEKSLEPVQGLVLTDTMARIIALQACLPILNLGFEWLDKVLSVVIYPDTFLSEVTEHDEHGVVHSYREPRSGESWERGPLIIAWSDVEADRSLDGHNVILHEVAHKLDALDGTTNGVPWLKGKADADLWRRAFTSAYEDLVRRVDSGEDTAIDPYAAESPAEFFAVFTEAFFETPDVIDADYPQVYARLASFYRQDPLARLRLMPMSAA